MAAAILIPIIIYNLYTDIDQHPEITEEHLLVDDNKEDSITDLIKKSQLHEQSFNASIASLVATSKDTITEIIKKSNEKHEITCVAQNIYYESRDQSYSGRVAVAMVTMNRAKLAKLPPCKIVFARNNDVCQFTWTCSAITPIYETAAWKESMVIAYLSYNHLVEDITSGATYYFNPSVVSPKWALAEIPVSNQYIRDGYLGSHKFFKPGPGDYFARN